MESEPHFSTSLIFSQSSSVLPPLGVSKLADESALFKVDASKLSNISVTLRWLCCCCNLRVLARPFCGPAALVRTLRAGRFVALRLAPSGRQNRLKNHFRKNHLTFAETLTYPVPTLTRSLAGCLCLFVLVSLTVLDGPIRLPVRPVWINTYNLRLLSHVTLNSPLNKPFPEQLVF